MHWCAYPICYNRRNAQPNKKMRQGLKRLHFPQEGSMSTVANLTLNLQKQSTNEPFHPLLVIAFKGGLPTFSGTIHCITILETIIIIVDAFRRSLFHHFKLEKISVTTIWKKFFVFSGCGGNGNVYYS